MRLVESNDRIARVQINHTQGLVEHNQRNTDERTDLRGHQTLGRTQALTGGDVVGEDGYTFAQHVLDDCPTHAHFSSLLAPMFPVN